MRKRYPAIIVWLILFTLSYLLCFVLASSEGNDQNMHQNNFLKRKRLLNFLVNKNKNKTPNKQNVIQFPDLQKNIITIIVNKYLPIKDNFTLLFVCKKMYNLFTKNSDFLFFHREEMYIDNEMDSENKKLHWFDLQYLTKKNYETILTFEAFFRTKREENDFDILTAIFATLTKEGNVSSWGIEISEEKKLKNIKTIVSTIRAFSALTLEGKIVSWGNSGNYIHLNEKSKNTQCHKLFSNDFAFAAITNEKNVITWGCQDSGGNSYFVQEKLKNIKVIVSTEFAFLALSEQGNAVMWGDADYGILSPKVPDELKNIKMIYSTESAFAALTFEGNVKTWGNEHYGGFSGHVQHELKNVKIIISTKYAFTALTYEGNVVTWGFENDEYNSICAQQNLKNVKMIYSTNSKFAALTMEGKLVIWGLTANTSKEIENVKRLFVSRNTFVIEKEDGKYVKWK